MDSFTVATSTNLLQLMSQCVGTENYYYNHFLSFKYTDGVKIFCDEARSYWLLNLIESVVHNYTQFFKDLISVILFVNNDKTAKIQFKSDEKIFYQQDIPYTDCPQGEWDFFFQNDVLFYEREY